MVDEGYEYKHNDTLITVFSASYYAGSAFNKGAVVEFNYDSGIKPSFFQYYAELPTNNINSNMKQDTLYQLKDRIFSNRAELLKQFNKLDKNDISKVLVDDWIKVMNDIIPIGVDWKALQPYLTETEDGLIDYTQFLNRYVINVGNTLSSSFQKNIIQKMCSRFVENMDSLKQAFKSVDKSGDGKLSYSEFMEMLKKFDFGLTEEQMFDFASSIDQDESGTIEFEEFLQRFQVEFEINIKDEKIKKQLQEISKKLLAQKDEATKIYKQIDDNGDGKISFTEFTNYIQKLGFDYSEKEFQGIFDLLDKEQQGYFDYNQFEKSFFVTDTQADEYTQNILQRVCAAIYKGRFKLKHLFRKMDLDGNGRIDLKEFEIGINALNSTLVAPLTNDQVKIIFDAVDKDHSGEIDYEEFIQAFQVVDMKEVKDGNQSDSENKKN